MVDSTFWRQRDASRYDLKRNVRHLEPSSVSLGSGLASLCCERQGGRKPRLPRIRAVWKPRPLLAPVIRTTSIILECYFDFFVANGLCAATLEGVRKVIQNMNPICRRKLILRESSVKENQKL